MAQRLCWSRGTPGQSGSVIPRREAKGNRHTQVREGSPGLCLESGQPPACLLRPYSVQGPVTHMPGVWGGAHGHRWPLGVGDWVLLLLLQAQLPQPTKQANPCLVYTRGRDEDSHRAQLTQRWARHVLVGPRTSHLSTGPWSSLVLQLLGSKRDSGVSSMPAAPNTPIPSPWTFGARRKEEAQSIP